MKENMKLEIIFEDNHILVVKKPPGVLSQSDVSESIDMLGILKTYLKESGNKPGNVYLGLVHRLDRNVGGLMVFAKTSKSASRLSEAIRKNQFKKTYLAIVEGRLKKAHGTLENYLLKDPFINKVTVFDTNREGAQYALLKYDLLSETNNNSLLKIQLKTGRSHQIRAQLSYMGYPILGDKKYGAKTSLEFISLWAYQLSFSHPVTKKTLEFKLLPPEASPWSDFKF
jgi:23S rRNA pseudouridine1911/1915/1917 synthase